MTDSWAMKVQKSTSTDSTAIRRRIPKACNYCRQRKIKCDGDSPCINCTSHKIDCVYSKTVRRRKRSQTKKLSLQDLDKRVNKLNQKLESFSEQMSKILMLLKKRDEKDISIKRNQSQSSLINDFNDKEKEFDEDEDDYEEDEDNEELDDEEDGDDDEEEGDDNDGDYRFHGKLNGYNLKQNQSKQEVKDENHLDIFDDSNSYPISPNESINSEQFSMDGTGSISSPQIANVSAQLIQDHSFTFNSQTIPDFDMTLNSLENAEQKLNYVYGEIPLIQTNIENEMF